MLKDQHEASQWIKTGHSDNDQASLLSVKKSVYVNSDHLRGYSKHLLSWIGYLRHLNF